MKMRTIKLTPKFVAESIQGKATSLISNLPDDVELLDVKFDLYSNQVIAVVRSDSFEDIPESYPIPELKIVCSSTSKVAQRPITSALTQETKLIPVSKPEPARIKKIETIQSHGTNKIEEEFSPEQRKLLNFKTEGEYTIVKPTQFLKAEWEDINEVVRSLGGKWVKGDIISYWQIPLQ